MILEYLGPLDMKRNSAGKPYITLYTHIVSYTYCKLHILTIYFTMRTGKICKNPRFPVDSSPSLHHGCQAWNFEDDHYGHGGHGGGGHGGHGLTAASAKTDLPNDGHGQEWLGALGMAGHGWAWLGSWGWLKPYLVGGLEHFFPYIYIYFGNNYNTPN